jgi:hypothetical protein
MRSSRANAEYKGSEAAERAELSRRRVELLLPRAREIGGLGGPSPNGPSVLDEPVDEAEDAGFAEG